MIVKTCLLISDDPDDHMEFSEALYEISNDTILVTVSDINKAIDLLTLKTCVPEFIFLNAGIPAFRADTFLDVLHDDPFLKEVQVIVFGGPTAIQSPRIKTFPGGDMTYSELKDTLRAVIYG